MRRGKDAAALFEELKGFRRRHRHLRGVYLIHDGDPSHTVAATATTWSGAAAGGGVGSPRSMPRGWTRRSCCSMRSATAT